MLSFEELVVSDAIIPFLVCPASMYGEALPMVGVRAYSVPVLFVAFLSLATTQPRRSVFSVWQQRKDTMTHHRNGVWRPFHAQCRSSFYLPDHFLCNISMVLVDFAGWLPFTLLHPSTTIMIRIHFFKGV